MVLGGQPELLELEVLEDTSSAEAAGEVEDIMEGVEEQARRLVQAEGVDPAISCLGPYPPNCRGAYTLAMEGSC